MLGTLVFLSFLVWLSYLVLPLVLLCLMLASPVRLLCIVVRALVQLGGIFMIFSRLWVAGMQPHDIERLEVRSVAVLMVSKKM